MAPIKVGKYGFNPESLVEVRTHLGLSQAKMAQLLGIPANTLSRWETGATTPDAESLAAVYSTALEHGLTPAFFKRRAPVVKPSKERSRLLVMWDFQNFGAGHQHVAGVNDWIKRELDKRFPATSYRRFKAFSHPSQSKSTDELQRLGWRVWEDDVDIDQEIINQSRSDCGQEPKDTVLIFITKDGDFVNLVQDLQAKGVDVYLFTPDSAYNQSLVRVVGRKHWLQIPISAPNLVSY